MSDEGLRPDAFGLTEDDLMRQRIIAEVGDNTMRAEANGRPDHVAALERLEALALGEVRAKEEAE